MLNLETSNNSQERIKDYLEKNATDTLVAKINNGIRIEKDGKELLSKKTLSGFMQYATDEARKLAEKGANCACVEDEVVFGWAMHYFEEDSIEGELFNLDGTAYMPVLKTKPKETAKPITPVKKNETFQLSLFDTQEEPVVTPEPIKPVKKAAPFYEQYKQLEAKYTDCILFVRLGDFYEVFGESAVVASRELDLTLTGRDCGLSERVPMCGIPYHAVDNYFNKLLEKGYKVGIAEKFDSEDVSVLSPDEDIEEMTEEEMQTFDGDIYDNVEDNPVIVVLKSIFGKQLEVKNVNR